MKQPFETKLLAMQCPGHVMNMVMRIRTESLLVTMQHETNWKENKNGEVIGIEYNEEIEILSNEDDYESINFEIMYNDEEYISKLRRNMFSCTI